MALPETGELDQRIFIHSWEDVGAGVGLTPEYEIVWPCWAKVVPVVGTNYWASKQTEEATTHRFIVRRVKGKTDPRSITQRHKIKYDGFWYLVRRTNDMEGKRIFTVIEVEQDEPADD